MALIEELENQGNYLFKKRSFIPLVFLGVGLAVFYFDKKNMNYPELGFNYWLACLVVGLVGLWIRIITVAHTPAGTSGRNTDGGQIAEQLNQTGIYSIVRHPLYLGNFLMWLAVVLITANLWFIVSFVLCYWLYYERIMFAEEGFLRSKFGKSYTDWASERPAFIPKLSMPTKSKYPFSIKKVIKSEKNGIFALFGLFYIFDIVGYYASWGEFKLNYNFWFWGCVLSGIFYFIFKIIKRSTQILEEEGR